MTRQVLLIEDDSALRASLAQTLDLEGISVIATDNYAHARRTIRANFNGVVLTDIRMPQHDGFDILDLARAADEELPVVMLTGQGDVPMAIRAMKAGAYDFLEKPCPTERLIEVLNRALSHRALVLRNRRVEQRLVRSDLASANFPGDSAASRGLRQALRAAADSGAHVVLTGAEGVGKKQASHTLFHLMGLGGRFQTEPAPLSADFILHADTTVMSLKRLEGAGETLERDIARLLAQRPALRLIGQTAGVAPAPLLALGALEVAVPDLAARHADLPAIFEELLRQAARNADRDMPPITPRMLARISGRHWAGNLAELRAFANAYLQGDSSAVLPQTLAERMERYERSVLEEVLSRHAGKATAAAEELGLPRKTFYDRLARYSLRPRDFTRTPLPGPSQ